MVIILMIGFIFVWINFKHPNYDSITFLNDLAILKLSQPVTFTPYIQPACLPNPSYGLYPSVDTSTTVYASGWVSFEKRPFDIFMDINFNILREP